MTSDWLINLTGAFGSWFHVFPPAALMVMTEGPSGAEVDRPDLHSVLSPGGVVRWVTKTVGVR